MTAAEEGVLLLCCSLGDRDSRPLTMAQFRDLGLRARAYGLAGDPMSELSRRDLNRLGYSDADAVRVLGLLNRQTRLEDYLCQGQQRGIVPITRVSSTYPERISARERMSGTPVLFAMGNMELLRRPAVSVVGARRLRPENGQFARSAGQCAARENLVLVSGGAVGADAAAQEACLEAGGSCIVVLPDRLMDKKAANNMLYLTEDGYDLPFTAARALHRNALIHILGEKTLAVQCTYGSGGTWQGCTENLKHGWSELYVYEDGSDGSLGLIERGGNGIRSLKSFADLTPGQIGLF